MDKLTDYEIAEKLEDILAQMENLISDAKSLTHGTTEGYRAKQWIRHISESLDGEYDAVTMQSTIDALKGKGE
jgi:hypothetical protein